MRSKWIVLLLVAACAVMFLASGAMAQKLLCVSAPTMKGEKTVAACGAAGDKFAYVDKNGLVRILSKEELDMTLAFNPNIAKMKAFGITQAGAAPAIAPMAPRLEP
jgi:hypothetical protein